MHRRSILIALLSVALAGCSTFTEPSSQRFADEKVSYLRMEYEGISRASLGELQIIKPSNDPAQRGKPTPAERRQSFAEAEHLNAVLSNGFSRRAITAMKANGLEVPTAKDAVGRLTVSIGAAHFDATQSPPKLTFICSAWLYGADDEMIWTFNFKVPTAPTDNEERELLADEFIHLILKRMRSDGVIATNR